MGARRRLVLLAAGTMLAGACGGGGGDPAAAVRAFVLLAVEVVGRPESVADATGGDSIRLEGVGFEPGASVLVGGAGPIDAAFLDATLLRAALPALPPGRADVTVRNPDGAETTLPLGLDVRAPPSIAAVTAVGGPEDGRPRADAGGGTVLAIAGTGLADAAEVRVGGAPAAVTGVQPDAVTVVAPAWPREETVGIELETRHGLRGAAPDVLAYTAEYALQPAAGALDRGAARHLLRRAAFGAPPEDVDRAVAEGLVATLARLFTVVASDAVDAEAAALFDVWPARSTLRTRTIQEWWLVHLYKNPNRLRERMAYFLHLHFATGDRNMNEFERWWLLEQIQTFRNLAFGSWRDLCVAVGTDRATLHWLDGLVSTDTKPNENFARELWELFMLGEANGYTEADVREASRAFTGFHAVLQPQLGFDEVRYDAGRHDAGAKTVFGRTGRFGYDGGLDPRDTDGGIVDLTLAERPIEASRHLARALFSFLVYPDPHPLVVDRLAAVVRAAGWQLTPVVRTLLESRAFFSRRARKAILKSPVDYAVGFLRATGIAMPPSQLNLFLGRLGQPLLQPPDAGGWPGGTAWLGAQAFLDRANFVNAAATPLVGEADVAHLLPAARTPESIVDALAARLGIDLAPAERAECVAYVTAYSFGGEILHETFDPADGARLATKVRGLLSLLAQHPEAHLE